MDFKLEGYKLDKSQVPKPPRLLGIKEKVKLIYLLIDSDEPITCSNCNSQDVVGYGSRSQRIVDIPEYNDKNEYIPVRLVIDRKRYKCKSCNAYFAEYLPDVNEKHRITKRAIKYLIDLFQNTAKPISISDLASRFGISYKTISSIIRSYSEYRPTFGQFDIPDTLGIHKIKIAHNQLYLITNVEKLTILDILPNNTQKIKDYLKKLNQQKTIEYVLIDIDPKIKDIIKASCPKSTIILNRALLFELEAQAFKNTVQKALGAKGQKASTQSELKQIDVLMSISMQNRYLELELQRYIQQLSERYPKLKSTLSSHKYFFQLFFSIVPDRNGLYRIWKRNILQNSEISSYYDELIEVINVWDQEIINAYNYRIREKYIEVLKMLSEGIKTMKSPTTINLLWNNLIEPTYMSESENKLLERVVSSYRFSIPNIEVERYGIDMAVLSNSIETNRRFIGKEK